MHVLTLISFLFLAIGGPIGGKVPAEDVGPLADRPEPRERPDCGAVLAWFDDCAKDAVSAKACAAENPDVASCCASHPDGLGGKYCGSI
jgi:hypothetical protein